MNTLHTVIHRAGRFTAMFGTFVALACAVAIIKVAPAGLDHPAKPAVEVVQLEPVVVTILKDRYATIRAEAQPSLFVRLFAKKPVAA